MEEIKAVTNEHDTMIKILEAVCNPAVRIEIRTELLEMVKEYVTYYFIPIKTK